MRELSKNPTKNPQTEPLPPQEAKHLDPWLEAVCVLEALQEFTSFGFSPDWSSEKVWSGLCKSLQSGLGVESSAIIEVSEEARAGTILAGLNADSLRTFPLRGVVLRSATTNWPRIVVAPLQEGWEFIPHEVAAVTHSAIIVPFQDHSNRHFLFVGLTRHKNFFQAFHIKIMEAFIPVAINHITSVSVRNASKTNESDDSNFRAERAEMEKRHALALLKRFLPERVAEQSVTGEMPIALDPTPRLITVLFSDIVDFTKISNTLRAKSIAKLLNTYLSQVSRVILENNGTVDKYIGDAVVAMFGAPDDATPAEQAARAVATARQMLKVIADLNKDWQSHGIPELRVRIGIHQGSAVVGLFGSSERSDYTAIGPTMNIAARLQTEAKPSSILITGSVADHLDDTLMEKLGTMTMKGLDESVLAFRVMTELNDESDSPEIDNPISEIDGILKKLRSKL